MKLLFTEKGWEDYLHWQQHNKSALRRINQLLRDVQREPFAGIGQPEPLRFGLSGCWSRRIDQEHRLVYQVAGDVVTVIQCRHHY